MPTAFKKCIIALTGDFDKPYEKVKKWIELQGGQCSLKIGPNVTHLVCSEDHYKKGVSMVQHARKLKKCKIVTWDWLEDSLLAKRPLRTGDFFLKGQVKTKAKVKATRKEIRDDNIIKGVGLFEKSCDEFKDKMYTGNNHISHARVVEMSGVPLTRCPDGYHIYRDSTGFSYDITLARSDLTTNTNARYFLKLYESHIWPSKYACFSSYSSPTAVTATHVLAPLGSTFSLAIEQFMHFFKLKTKLDWKERNGTLDKESETAFLYTPPAEGEPWGVVDPTSIW